MNLTARALTKLTIAAAIAVCPTTVSADELAEGFVQPDAAELKERIAKLERQVQILGAILEGTAQPVNLGRTSIASVTAATVNGGRSLCNRYYGILNAFDGGDNWHNKINYSYWLSSGGTGQWVEVRFQHPVSITSIHIQCDADRSPGCHAKLTFAKGGEQHLPMVEGELRLPVTMHGVDGVRLSFGQARGNIRVNEICVMGQISPEVKYKQATPRLLSNQPSGPPVPSRRESG